MEHHSACKGPATAYVRWVPRTGSRTVWTELKPGALSIDQSGLPMTRCEWHQFKYMQRQHLRKEQVGKVSYSIQTGEERPAETVPFPDKVSVPQRAEVSLRP